MQLLHLILAIILPPVGVGLKQGVGRDFVINVILTLLFWVPGVIHALWIVFKK
ncbi:MAG TPA: YqaE/Pmp3 family membrane protein [Opitutaceae bacterium]